jgi:nucleoid DNA-binding protein
MEAVLSYKKEIAKELSVSANTSISKANEMIGKTFELVLDILAKNGRVELRNFGVLELAKRKAKVARNPRTGEPVFIPSRYAVKFKPSKEMIDRVIEENKKKKECSSINN